MHSSPSTLENLELPRAGGGESGRGRRGRFTLIRLRENGSNYIGAEKKLQGEMPLGFLRAYQGGGASQQTHEKRL